MADPVTDAASAVTDTAKEAVSSPRGFFNALGKTAKFAAWTTGGLTFAAFALSAAPVSVAAAATMTGAAATAPVAGSAALTSAAALNTGFGLSTWGTVPLEGLGECIHYLGEGAQWASDAIQKLDL